MELTVTVDAEAFAARAQRFLEATVERNILAVVLRDVLDGRYRAERAVFGYVSDARGAVRGAALRTPPWVMIVADIGEGEADPLIERWLAEDPELPGVGGMPSSAGPVARAWVRATGGRARTRIRLLIHELDRVLDPPRPAEGTLRSARPEERELMIEWFEDFFGEVEIGDANAEQLVDPRLADGGLQVWDHHGFPVSLVAMHRPVAGVVRIGPVYTPPPHRRRGYAGTAVAAASRLALGRGAHSCTLTTDLANPTSNKIYAEVGYRCIGDWEEVVFERAVASFGDDPPREGALRVRS